MADEPAWLPGPLEGDGQRRPGLKERFSNSTFTDSRYDAPIGPVGNVPMSGGGTGNETASMSLDTEKRRNPGGRKYDNKKYHKWETEKGNPLAGPRRRGPTDYAPSPFMKHGPE